MTNSIHDAVRRAAADVVRMVAPGEPGDTVAIGQLREELIPALERALLDKELLDEYCETLDKCRSEMAGDTPQLDMPDSNDWPVETIGESGLAILTDEQLLRLAQRPIGLRLLSSYLWEVLEEKGVESIWFRSLDVESYTANLEDLEELERKFNEREAKAKPNEDNLNPVEIERPSTDRHQKQSRQRNVFLAALALAASLLLGFFIGQTVQNSPSVYVAKLETKEVIERGPDNEILRELLDVRVTSPMEGFLTLVAALSDQPLQVHPMPDQDEIPVGPNLPHDLTLEQTDAMLVIAIITETPADETIRRLIRHHETVLRQSQDSFVEDELRKLLQAKGFRDFALGYVVR